jgi:hypothetical protein
MMRAMVRITLLLAALLALPAGAQAEETTNRFAGLAEIPEPPFSLELPGGFTLVPHAHIQLWATAFDMDDPEANDPIVIGDPDHREGFTIRRARVGIGGNWNNLLGMSVMGGWNDRYDALQQRPSGFELVEAIFWFTPWDEFGVMGGVGRVAFGRQLQVSSNNLTLHERAMLSNAIAPDREPGLMLFGALGPKDSGVLPDNAFSYQVSITNGGGDFTGDLDPAPRLSGRVRLDLFAPWDNKEVNVDLPPLALSVGGSAGHVWALEADTTQAGADIGLRVWRFTVLGEFAWQRAVPTFDVEGIPEVLAQRDAIGVLGHVGFVIVPDWLDINVRVDWLDDHTDLADAGDRLDITGGLGLYLLNRHLRLQVDWVHREELTEGHATPNDSLVLLMQARL